MDRPTLFRLDRPVRKVHRFTEHVEHSSQSLGTDGHRNGRAGVDDVHPSRHAVGGLHCDCTHTVLPEVLFDFGDDVDLLDANAALRHDSNRVVDLGKTFGKFDVDDGPDDLDNPTDFLRCCCLCHNVFVLRQQGRHSSLSRLSLTTSPTRPRRLR
jgi:hypothetical protein